MRLIDADAVNIPIRIESGRSVGVGNLGSMLDDEPTIDAIPIAWIENWMYGLYFGNSDEVCKKLIADWRKDNGIIRVADNS